MGLAGTATRALACLFTGLLFLAAPVRADPLPPLPVAHSNNAVAKLELDGGAQFYSFMGLTAGKTYADISRQAFEYDVTARRWRTLPDVPVAHGRLASTAVGVGGLVYLFGGYTVAADGKEVSTPEVLAFDPRTNSYTPRAPMPVPVDDSVGVPFNDRYIYLVSGWHDTDNVRLVQVYDTVKDHWFRATEWPGLPVFGHAGGIVDNKLVIADGVTVLAGVKGRGRFKLTGQAWLGEIDRTDPAKIAWRRLPDHTGKPLYRAAATGSPIAGRVVFAGGSEIAYNYNGQGYDGSPADPSSRILAFDLRSNEWATLSAIRTPSMDHRGLLEHDGIYYTLGGMDTRREVIGDMIAFTAGQRETSSAPGSGPN